MAERSPGKDRVTAEYRIIAAMPAPTIARPDHLVDTTFECDPGVRHDGGESCVPERSARDARWLNERSMRNINNRRSGSPSIPDADPPQRNGMSATRELGAWGRPRQVSNGRPLAPQRDSGLKIGFLPRNITTLTTRGYAGLANGSTAKIERAMDLPRTPTANSA